MTKFVVGKRFPFPVVGMFMLRLFGNQLNVVLNFPDPTDREQDAFQDGNLLIGLYQHPSGQAFFLTKFEMEKNLWQWMDVPIHYSQNPEEYLKEFYDFCDKIEGQDKKTTFMTLFMIDSNTQILKQMRVAGPSPSFLLKLRDIFRMQEEKEIPYDETMIQLIYGQMDSDEMADKAQERMFLRKA